MHLLCRVRLRFRHRLPAFLLHFGRDLEELLLGRHLMRDAIMCTQTQSELLLGRHLMRDAIMCTQTQSELLLGRHLMRDAIRRHQTASDGHQTPSDAIKHRSPRSVLARARFAIRRPSDAIKHHQAPVTSFRSRSREICMYGSSEAVSTWMTSSTEAEMLMR